MATATIKRSCGKPGVEHGINTWLTNQKTHIDNVFYRCAFVGLLTL